MKNNFSYYFFLIKNKEETSGSRKYYEKIYVINLKNFIKTENFEQLIKQWNMDTASIIFYL